MIRTLITRRSHCASAPAGPGRSRVGRALRVVVLSGVVASLVLAATPAPAATAPAGALTGATVAAAGTDAPGQSLSLPSIHRHRIPVRTVGMSGGAIQVPANADVAGRWQGSRSWSARSGSSIVVGHVSDTADRPGAFARLGRLQVGDRIVWRAEGRRKIFKVVEKTFTRRTANLPDRIWRASGPRVLNLVSCARKVVYPSGYYHYTHNVTVTAKLVATR